MDFFWKWLNKNEREYSEERLGDDKIILVGLFVFIFLPMLIYFFVIEVNPILGFDEDGDPIRLGLWIIIILWWALSYFSWKSYDAKRKLNNILNILLNEEKSKVVSGVFKKKLENIIRRYAEYYGLKINLNNIVFNFGKEPFIYFESQSVELIDTEKFVTMAGLEYSVQLECFYIEQSGENSIITEMNRDDNDDNRELLDIIYDEELSEEEKMILQKHINRFHHDLSEGLSKEINDFKKELIDNR